ncbi:alpha/beta fold hydrolase [Dictyobacter halimunensis]
MAYITTNDSIQLHYTRKGSGTKTLVLVHGWQVSSAVWNLVADELSRKYQLIIVDLRGAGASNAAPGPYTVEQHSEDLFNLVQSLELKNFVLVGHSMGGAIAQRFAADHCELLVGLIVIASVPASGLELPADFQAFFRSAAGNRSQTEALWKVFIANPLAAETFTMLLDSSMTVKPEACLESFDSWRQLNFADEVKRIMTPTLVIAPEADNPMTPDFLREKIVALIPNSRLRVIEKTSHYAQLEQPQELGKLITHFVDELCSL